MIILNTIGRIFCKYVHLHELFSDLKSEATLTGVAQLVGVCPVTERLCLILHQGIYLGCGLHPSSGRIWEAGNPCFSLSKNNEKSVLR